MNREDEDAKSSHLADLERRVWEGDLAEDDEEYVKAQQVAEERRARRSMLEAEAKTAKERDVPRSWKQEWLTNWLEIRCKQLEERLSWQKTRTVAARLAEQVAREERDRCESQLDLRELLLDELQEKIVRLEDELRRVRSSVGGI